MPILSMQRRGIGIRFSQRGFNLPGESAESRFCLSKSISPFFALSSLRGLLLNILPFAGFCFVRLLRFRDLLLLKQLSHFLRKRQSFGLILEPVDFSENWMPPPPFGI